MKLTTITICNLCSLGGNAAHTISGVGVAAPTRSLDLDEGIANQCDLPIHFSVLGHFCAIEMCCVICSPRFYGTQSGFKPTIRLSLV